MPADAVLVILGYAFGTLTTIGMFGATGEDASAAGEDAGMCVLDGTFVDGIATNGSHSLLPRDKTLQDFKSVSDWKFPTDGNTSLVPNGDIAALSLASERNPVVCDCFEERVASSAHLVDGGHGDNRGQQEAPLQLGNGAAFDFLGCVKDLATANASYTACLESRDIWRGAADKCADEKGTLIEECVDAKAAQANACDFDKYLLTKGHSDTVSELRDAKKELADLKGSFRSLTWNLACLAWNRCIGYMVALCVALIAVCYSVQWLWQEMCARLEGKEKEMTDAGKAATKRLWEAKMFHVDNAQGGAVTPKTDPLFFETPKKSATPKDLPVSRLAKSKKKKNKKKTNRATETPKDSHSATQGNNASVTPKASVGDQQVVLISALSSTPASTRVLDHSSPYRRPTTRTPGGPPSSSSHQTTLTEAEMKQLLALQVNEERARIECRQILRSSFKAPLLALVSGVNEAAKLAEVKTWDDAKIESARRFLANTARTN